MVGVTAPDYLQQLNLKTVILELSIHINTTQNVSMVKEMPLQWNLDIPEGLLKLEWLSTEGSMECSDLPNSAFDIQFVVSVA